VKEGIDEAIKLLKTCRACRKFFGEVNPVSQLKKLRKRRAIIVSNNYHTGYEQAGVDSFVLREIGVMNSSMTAAIIDLAPNKKKRGHGSPCIYVNPSRFLVDPASFASETKSSPFYGLTLPQARALAILHELAHIAGVIPPDGILKDGNYEPDIEISEASTRCVRANCLPCADHSQACAEHPASLSSQRHRRPFKPKRHSSILRRIVSGPSCRLGLGS
jgi:hypothetical protein